MLNVYDLEFGRDDDAHSPRGDQSSSYHLSSSVPFGFSIQEAIKELSLEEDGDVKTFLAKSINLLVIAPPASPSTMSPSPSPSRIDIKPNLHPLHLHTVSCTWKSSVHSPNFLPSYPGPHFAPFGDQKSH